MARELAGKRVEEKVFGPGRVRQVSNTLIYQSNQLNQVYIFQNLCQPIGSSNLSNFGSYDSKSVSLLGSVGLG